MRWLGCSLVGFVALFSLVPSARAGSHWSYCRLVINSGKDVKTYYSGVFFYDFGGGPSYDPRVAEDVRKAFRRYVTEQSGIDPHMDPYCFIPLPVHEATQADAEERKKADQKNIEWSNPVETGWHP